MINPIITRFSAFAGVVLMSMGGAAANARTSDVGNALDRAETRTELVTGQQAANGPVTVTGTITDQSGLPVPGAAVMVAGTNIGVVSDLDGKYSLTIDSPEADTQLQVSILGYETQTLPLNGRAVVNVVLNEESTLLEGVVVTALGIEREEKALSYNVQEVSSDIVNTVKDANFVNSLSGKVAGLQISQSSSGAGGSTRVIMRGVKSISGNNNALYVVDGIPMPNLRSTQVAGIYETPDGGDFEGISNLNPEDFESMTVMTGATAAALYGSQGANGVILITTKKGSEGKVRVNYSNNTTFSSPFVLPQFQNTYGTDATAPNMSWGAKLDTPSDYDPRDFFQTGFNTTNALSVSGGTERNQTYISLASTNSRGIIPNNVYNRYNVSMRNTTELVKDKLTLDLSASYMKQYKRNPTVQGQYHNPLVPIYLFPRGSDIRKYQIYERWDPEQGIMAQFWDLSFVDGSQNPYWETNRNLFENTAHRYTLNGTLKWQITDWLSVMGRARLDNTVMNYTIQRPVCLRIWKLSGQYHHPQQFLR